MRLLCSSTRHAGLMEQVHMLMERLNRFMSRLIDDLLDVLRPRTDKKMQLDRKRIDLRLVVTNAIQTQKVEIEARRHLLAASLPEKPVWVMADPLRLEQVFADLLGNAVEYTQPGGQLAVWIHASGKQAIVRIRDSGQGIASQALPHVFDVLRQADGADTRSKSGFGTDLAPVRDLVQLHGGAVTAASRGSGQGSEFTVRMPCEM
jgi:signal transduction histidine kinase